MFSIDGETLLPIKSEPIDTENNDVQFNIKCEPEGDYIKSEPESESVSPDNYINGTDEIGCTLKSEISFSEYQLGHIPDNTTVESPTKQVKHRDESEETIAYDVNRKAKIFACPDCEKKFPSKYRLIEHQLIHGEKLFACNECDKRFHLKRILNEHLLIHTGHKPFACNLCEKKFLKKCNLKEHIRIVHNGEKRITRKKFQETNDGRENKIQRKDFANKRIKSEKVFACPDCEKKFPSKYRLIEHQFSHGEKLFACSECDKRFHLKRILNEHSLIHTGHKPFACNLCEKKFLKKCNLKEHVRVVHNGESRFACNQCQKRFWRKDKLELHERMCHTQDVPIR